MMGAVVYSAPTILRFWVHIPRTPSRLLEKILSYICHRFEKSTKINKQRGRVWPIFSSADVGKCPYCQTVEFAVVLVSLDTQT